MFLQNEQKMTRKFWEVMGVFSASVVMVSRVSAYVQTHQDVIHTHTLLYITNNDLL